MAISFVVGATGTTDINAATTSAMDTTGCNLLVVVGTNLDRVNPLVITDSKSNSWTALTLTSADPGVERSVQIHYSTPSSVGSGHTVTGTLTGKFPGLSVMCFSGAHTTPYDGNQNGTYQAGSASTIQPGSVTPSQNNCLVISGVIFNLYAGAAPTINGGFTVGPYLPFTSGQSLTTVGGYLIQTSAAAANPTWTFGSAESTTVANAAVFRAAASSGTLAAVDGIVIANISKCQGIAKASLLSYNGLTF